jgi:hypothetical protein
MYLQIGEYTGIVFGPHGLSHVPESACKRHLKYVQKKLLSTLQKNSQKNKCPHVRYFVLKCSGNSAVTYGTSTAYPVSFSFSFCYILLSDSYGTDLPYKNLFFGFR